MASTPFSNLTLPQFNVDPNYTSAQDQLSGLGSTLLSGGQLPGNLSSIGEADSPAFQAMLNSVKGQIMQGSQESSAINGTARSGVATTASNNALDSVVPSLTYQDFLNAQSQQVGLLNTGVGVEQGVRSSGQQQQEDQFNAAQSIFGDQATQAQLINSFKTAASGAIGGAIGTGIGAVGGAIPGILTGNPLLAIQGASAGAGIGDTIGGGSNNTNSVSSLSSLLASLGKIGPGTSGASYGISDPTLGSFKSLSSVSGAAGPDDITKLLNP